MKVFTADDKRRTGLYFDPSRTPYMSAKEEREAEESRGKGTRVPSSKDASKNSFGQEGGIDIVVVRIDEPCRDFVSVFICNLVCKNPLRFKKVLYVTCHRVYVS